MDKLSKRMAFVRTIKDMCRVCYTCVRECPAKAIKISDGQAEIIPINCIACGHCTGVCSQGAKVVISTSEKVMGLLKSEHRVAACIAPSFPAEFTEFDFTTLIGMLRRLGFDLVTEVAFGADMVAAEYHNLLKEDDGKRYIATTCPATVGYVEKYHPDLVDNLAPIVSPMIAMARAIRKLHGEDLKVIFIGPCIAKKVEGKLDIEGNIDEAITFGGLRRMFERNGIAPEPTPDEDFDPPHPGLGALFPISGGMLQAANIKEDLVTGDVVSAQGLTQFTHAIDDFESGKLDAKLLEILCCDGCIMGPGMTSKDPLFQRRSKVSRHIRSQLPKHSRDKWEEYIERVSSISLDRLFEADDQRLLEPSEEELFEILRSMHKLSEADELNCGACGYHSCRSHAQAIFRGRAEKEMCLPFIIDRLTDTVDELQTSNKKLATTQEALMQSEKLASMGQLAAGVAHEVNNPLGVVLMYAHLLLEETDEGSPEFEDLQRIASEADRCKKIVSNLLDFARQNKVSLQECNAVELCKRALSSVIPPDNVEVILTSKLEDPTCELDHDQMLQVLTNIVSNSIAAMKEGGKLFLLIDEKDGRLLFTIKDTGTGIPREIREKIFEPFFTTKAIGKGTGLGLAVAYGIVKLHRGAIEVDSNCDPSKGPTGTTFSISLPKFSPIT